MNKLHFIFATFLGTILLLSSGLANSKSTQTDLQDVTIPKGYESLFNEISNIMKKYPGASDRFRVFDRKTNMGDDKQKSSFRACCEWACKEPRCECTKLCLE